jgi:PAS domain S-box-containing protein
MSAYIVDEKIELDPKKYIVSKTDTEGIIEYANDYFIEVSGYNETELVGEPHSIVRHPDMPKIIFKIMWDRLEEGKNIYAIVKNRAKDGRYYWIITDFESNLDKVSNKPISYVAYRQAASDKIVDEIEPLYKKLLEIEKTAGMDGSHKYLNGYLEEQGKSYDEYMEALIGSNKGLAKKVFAGVKGIFKRKKKEKEEE